MNQAKTLRTAISNMAYKAFLHGRLLLPAQRTQTFTSVAGDTSRIGQVYVINLDRETGRWADVTRELRHVLDNSGASLSGQTTRFAAVDARQMPESSIDDESVYPFYTLADQLLVEPQPAALPDAHELERPIRMSRAEIAVARSHIRIWERIAAAPHGYALVLEDDVVFARDFAPLLDRAWAEMCAADQSEPQFDILYLSYNEVRGGARKTPLSGSVFRPECGLWYFSGYVLSKKGAQKLLDLLPCRGPVDLWINHHFHEIDVRAVRKSIIGQRRDLHSSNSYSILPSLVRIGVLDSVWGAPFQEPVQGQPVFVFGTPASGMTALASALSMLGYRCCHDLERLPEAELANLLDGSAVRVFNAYVNIGGLSQHISALRARYPLARFIVTESTRARDKIQVQHQLDQLAGAEVLLLAADEKHKWDLVCEHLRCKVPAMPYPKIRELGQRKLLPAAAKPAALAAGEKLEHDVYPWVVDVARNWAGIQLHQPLSLVAGEHQRVAFNDDLQHVDRARWQLRSDTFPGNLALFRPQNVVPQAGSGIVLAVKEEALGVRSFSAAALTSRQEYLYGRFDVTLRSSGVSGLVTGFFLYRDSPWQEIDMEIVGNRSDHLLVNVYYNPGGKGAKFNYGQRGTPALIPLGFDASAALHSYAIEWDPAEIRWYVDGRLLHRRVVWNPTPIPYLPMALHVNTWPSRSRELAGRIAKRALPGITMVESIAVDAAVITASVSPLRTTSVPVAGAADIATGQRQVVSSHR